MKGEKGVVKRKSKYKIQSYLNQNREMIIQAKLNGQVHRWMKEYDMWQTTVLNASGQAPIAIEANQYQLIDLKDHRNTRTKSQLMNTYLSADIAVMMLLLDCFWLLLLKMYLSWSITPSFQHVYPQILIVLLVFHSIYCMCVYVSQKHKQHIAMLAQEEGY